MRKFFFGSGVRVAAEKRVVPLFRDNVAVQLDGVYDCVLPYCTCDNVGTTGIEAPNSS